MLGHRGRGVAWARGALSEACPRPSAPAKRPSESALSRFTSLFIDASRRAAVCPADATSLWRFSEWPSLSTRDVISRKSWFYTFEVKPFKNFEVKSSLTIGEVWQPENALVPNSWSRLPSCVFYSVNSYEFQYRCKIRRQGKKGQTNLRICLCMGKWNYRIRTQDKNVIEN